MLKTIREDFLNGKYNDVLANVYCGEEFVQEQVNRYIKAIDKFEELYGNREVEIYSAPGRSEIGGNHTDHQNGKVLAAAINLDAIAVVAKRNDSIIRVTSEGYSENNVDITNLDVIDNEKGTTDALIRGTAAAMSKRGYSIGGFDAYVTSNVLSGSGLSSSASYEVLIANVLSGLYNCGNVDVVTLAQIAKEAENVHFGKPCGLLDQMASSVGGIINVDFKDKEHPELNVLDVDFNKYNHLLCIVDTKGSHLDLTDEYAAITQEMKKISMFFGKEYLSEVDKDEFYAHITETRISAGDRAVLRTMHWYAENDRVDKQVKALQDGDFEYFKKLITDSGNSSFKYLQNVYSAKNVQSQGVSVALCLSEEILKGKGVSRVHGGGFAGTIQAFVPSDIVDEYKNRMEEVFGKDACYILSVRPVGGFKIVG